MQKLPAASRNVLFCPTQDLKAVPVVSPPYFASGPSSLPRYHNLLNLKPLETRELLEPSWNTRLS